MLYRNARWQQRSGGGGHVNHEGIMQERREGEYGHERGLEQVSDIISETFGGAEYRSNSYLSKKESLSSYFTLFNLIIL